MKLMQWGATSLRVTAASLLVFFVATVCPGVAWIPTVMAAARQDLVRAQDLYDFAEFQQSLDLVTVLIDGGQLTETEARDAYVLRARNAIGLGLTDQAKDDFCQAYRLDQTWKPDPVIFPQEEVDAFNAAIAGCKLTQVKPAKADDGSKKTPWYAKPVTWVVAGVVVVGAVVLGSGGGDDSPPADPPLEGFPDPPTKK